MRDDQRTAIRSLVDDAARTLVVQATGWGKSAVYFIATRLLRDTGAGPTLIVSPLLALMRDQLAAARSMGLVAETLNSTNVDDWAAIERRIAADEVDLLLVSPERLNHPRFRAAILERLVARIGMLVIDEAHCISDHGHDFRPDYRRLGEVLALLDDARAGDVPVLACTATATDRVVDDVVEQLGGASPDAVAVLRGPLARATLTLNVVHLSDHEHRLAYLAALLADHRAAGRAGIVYTLTVADAERTAAFLHGAGHDVAAYTGRLDAERRQRLEDDLRANRLEALVATTALSMGYDKPDVGFVAHLGAPSSPVAYYQAVGRAGRGGHRATVVCLPTGADEEIWSHFDVAGIPTEPEVTALLAALESDTPSSLPALESKVDVRRSRLELLCKILDVEGVLARVEGGYLATGRAYVHDRDRYERLLAGRRREHAVMRAYLDADGTACRMRTLTSALDDPASADCGRCDRCTGLPLSYPLDGALVGQAREELRRHDVVLHPRRRWPTGLDRLGHARRGNIDAPVRPLPGRALSDRDLSGWGTQVAELLDGARAGAPDPRLLAEVVEGLVAVLARWDWPQRPTAIVPVPDPVLGELNRLLARRLGELGRLQVHEQALVHTAPSTGVEPTNSAHQAAAALDQLAAGHELPGGPLLLVDAQPATGWTTTVAAVRLREGGAGPVLPLILRG